MNPSSLLCLLNLCLFASLGMAAPDRMRFAMEDRPIEGVPVEAFELIDENLTIELWARSPLIYSPVAMDFDAQGRLWLTEGIDYQRGLRIEEGRSIMVLEDQDGDGEADSSHVFVTEKEIRHAPLGIAVFDNRIVLSVQVLNTIFEKKCNAPSIFFIFSFFIFSFFFSFFFFSFFFVSFF